LLSVDLRKVEQIRGGQTTKIGIKMCVRQREKERETDRISALQKRTNVSTYRFRSSDEATSP
jgi:hypothetical protein